GNYTANIAPNVSGGSTVFENLETIFQQDLNGDGTIGVRTTTIESLGSTSLLQTGNNYELGTAGPILKYNGAQVVSGQFASWAPIGAEHTATGFDVAWKWAGADLYTVWTTDAN
ncbi:hypothetical protein MTR72_40260, partial [Bradyrhizobium sp. ISRA442]